VFAIEAVPEMMRIVVLLEDNDLATHDLEIKVIRIVVQLAALEADGRHF
jgi:hypothetical protein